MELDPITQALNKIRDGSLANDKAILDLIESLIKLVFKIQDQLEAVIEIMKKRENQ